MFTTNGGVVDVPKYTSYDVAPATGDHVSTGINTVPVAPAIGEGIEGVVGNEGDAIFNKKAFPSCVPKD